MPRLLGVGLMSEAVGIHLDVGGFYFIRSSPPSDSLTERRKRLLIAIAVQTPKLRNMRMSKHGYGLLAIICLASSLWAQPRAETGTRHTLWKVQGPSNSVHLLGSVHVLKRSDYPLAVPIEKAFSNAAVVAFETDIAALDDPAVAMKLMSKGQLPAGETLLKQLSPEVYKMWLTHVTEAGLPPQMFEQFTPAMAGLTVAMLEIQKLGLDPNQGVDKHFFA